MRKFLVGAAVATVVAGATIAVPPPEAQAVYCPGAVNVGSFRMWLFFSEIVVEFCDWAPPVMGVDSHKHCEYGGYFGYGGRCDWRNSANVIVPPPPGFV